MSFIWPIMLWFILIPAAVAVLYILLQRRRQAFAIRYASVSLLREAVGKGPGFKRHLPAIFFLSALAILFFALSRPIATIPLLAQQGIIMLTLDASGSMRATDVSPSRMEAAKTAAKAFVERQGGSSRIGVVSFAASANLVQAPTYDKEAVLSAIDRLEMQRGTAIGNGILTSLNAILEAYGEKTINMQPGYTSLDEALGEISPNEDLTGAVVVMLSDGQSNTGYPPLDVVDKIAKRGLRIYTVGLGSTEGTVLNYYERSARVTLDEDTLKRIAEKTGAVYFRAGSDTDLRQIYEGLGTKLVLKSEKTEVTAVFAALGILLLLGAAGVSLRWFNRLP